MRVVGIAVDAKDPRRPTVHVVLADNASGSPMVEDTIDLSGDDESMPAQLHHAAEGVRAYLRSINAERVVVRRADHSPRARQTDGTKNRLLVEGAVTSAAASVVPETRLGTGKETGEWFGSSKADVDAEAKALLNASSRHSRYAAATSAALAGIVLGA